MNFLQALREVIANVGKELATTSVKRFGAKGDGITNDRPAIQATIDHLANKGGGVGVAPRGDYRLDGPLTPRSNVTLWTPAANYAYAAGGLSTTQLRAKGGMNALFTASGDVSNFAIDGFTLHGDGTAKAGIDLPGAYWCAFRNLNFFGFGERYLRIGSGYNSRLERILATNGGGNLTGTSGYVGLVELGGSDHSLSDLEISYVSNTPSVYSGGMWITPLLISATNCMIDSTVSEFGETGAVITGNLNKFTISRADNSYGHGWVVRGFGNVFSGCNADSNGKRTNGVYSAWRAEAAGNVFLGPIQSSGATNKPKYAFEDLVNQNGVRNEWIGRVTSGAFTDAAFKGESYLGSSPGGQGHILRLAGATAGTIDVTLGQMVHLDFAGTTITKMTGGVTGQRVTLFTGASGMKLADNNAADGFYLGAGDVTLTPNRGFSLIYDSGKWLAG